MTEKVKLILKKVVVFFDGFKTILLHQKNGLQLRPCLSILCNNCSLLLQIVDYESKYVGGQRRDELPKTRGSWSYIFHTILSLLLKSLRGNISLVVEKEFATQNKDGTLTGCYRSTRDNESDVSLLLTDFSTIDYDKVDSYQIVMEHHLKIFCGYHSKTEADVSFNDFILTSIESFDSQTWFAVSVLITAFFGFWMIKRTHNNDVCDTQQFEDAYADNEDSIQAKFWTKYNNKTEMVGLNSNLAKMMQELFDSKRVNLLVSGGLWIVVKPSYEISC